MRKCFSIFLLLCLIAGFGVTDAYALVWVCDAKTAPYDTARFIERIKDHVIYLTPLFFIVSFLVMITYWARRFIKPEAPRYNAEFLIVSPCLYLFVVSVIPHLVRISGKPKYCTPMPLFGAFFEQAIIAFLLCVIGYIVYFLSVFFDERGRKIYAALTMLSLVTLTISWPWIVFHLIR